MAGVISVKFDGITNRLDIRQNVFLAVADKLVETSEKTTKRSYN